VSSLPMVDVVDVHKSFRLYHEVNRSVKSMLARGKRARFEEFEALKGVTFQVPEGSTFGIVGGNGSGKSTMLKCIAKILRPASGTITTRGRTASLLELGSGFHPELSGRDNVFLNASILGLSRRETQARFDDIVDFSGIGEFIDSPVKNYSSGMYVRLGFSVAIHVDPELFLVDEVLAVGDEQFQRRCAEKFSDMQKRGRTIVLVSHTMGQVRDLCDHALWLQNGVPRALGEADHVVAAYLDEQDRLDSLHRVVRQIVVQTRRGDGTLVTDLRSGEPFLVQAQVELADEVSELTVKVELVERSGVAILQAERPVVPVGHEWSGTIEVPALQLRAGEYSVRVSAEPSDGRPGAAGSCHFLVGGGGRATAILDSDLQWLR
jgi:lipopolysaccharide transport system ATP-binding protein